MPLPNECRVYVFPSLLMLGLAPRHSSNLSGLRNRSHDLQRWWVELRLRRMLLMIVGVCWGGVWSFHWSCRSHLEAKKAWISAAPTVRQSSAIAEATRLHQEEAGLSCSCVETCGQIVLADQLTLTEIVWCDYVLHTIQHIRGIGTAYTYSIKSSLPWVSFLFFWVGHP